MNAIIQLITSLFKLFKPKVEQLVEQERQEPKIKTSVFSRVNANGFAEAKQFFIDNQPAYQRGKQAWGTFDYEGAVCNSMLYVEGERVYRRFEYNKDMSTFYYVGSRSDDSYKSINKKNDTFCNQVVGLFTWHIFGIDFDQVAGHSFNANSLIENMKNDKYPLNMKKIERENISKDCLTIATFHNPGGTGHVAVIDIFQDNDELMIIQAGKNTGCMTIEEGFGQYMPQVEYYEVTK